LNEVNAALENPDVWNEPKRAQELGREKKSLETVVGTIDHLASNLADNAELYEMSKADGDFDGWRHRGRRRRCARRSRSSSSAACSATRPTR
jgi:protein subunit release factor A